MWQVFVATFVSIFLAELGDKTQIAVFTAGAGANKWVVFAAASLALVTSTALALAASEIISTFISPALLRRGAGVVFVLMGIYFLSTKP